MYMYDIYTYSYMYDIIIMCLYGSLKEYECEVLCIKNDFLRIKALKHSQP